MACDGPRYDKARYDFRAKLTSLLGWAGPHIGFGSFREGDTELEMFQAKEAGLRSLLLGPVQ